MLMLVLSTQLQLLLLVLTRVLSPSPLQELTQSMGVLASAMELRK